MWEIEYYKTARSKEVVGDFISSLHKKLYAKAICDIDILSDLGTTLTEPHVKYIEDGLWELRIQFSKDIPRVFYFYPVKDSIVLLHGFIKKTQKTPRREIETAKQRMVDYLERYNRQ